MKFHKKQNQLMRSCAAIALALGCDPAVEAGRSYPSGVEGALAAAEPERCSDVRFQNTLEDACVAAEYTVSIHAKSVGSTDFTGSTITPQTAYGVWLESTSPDVYAGELRFSVPEDGEYILYLGNATARSAVRRADGTNVAFSCNRYLPHLSEVTYDRACELREGSAVHLRADETYILALGPVANHWLRVALFRRGGAGDTTTGSTRCAASVLTSTIADACSAASETTPLRAAPFGGESAQVEAGIAYGVHLRLAAEAYEGSLLFVPPYTGNYVVYVGTPNAGLTLFGPGSTPNPSTCARWFDDQIAEGIGGVACPSLRGAFFYPRLRAGERYRFEIGPLSSQSWVRAVVLPTAPDADRDRNADDLVPGEILWSRNTEIYQAPNLALTERGESVVVGSWQGSQRMSVTKFDSAGNNLWRQIYDRYSSWTRNVRDVAVSKDGRIAIAWYEELDHSGYYTEHSEYVGWLDKLGNFVASARVPEGGHSDRVVFDAAGNLYAVGRVNKVQGEAISIRKFDLEHQLLWEQSYDSDLNDMSNAIAVTEQGDLIVVGTAGNDLAQGRATVLREYAADGALAWTQRIESTDYPRGVAIDLEGNLWLASGSSLYKLDSRGTLLWTRSFGLEMLDVAAYREGGALVVGSTHPQSQQYAQFIRVDAAGDPLWVRTDERPGSYANAVVLDTQGNALAAGQVAQFTGGLWKLAP